MTIWFGCLAVSHAEMKQSCVDNNANIQSLIPEQSRLSIGHELLSAARCTQASRNQSNIKYSRSPEACLTVPRQTVTQQNDLPDVKRGILSLFLLQLLRRRADSFHNVPSPNLYTKHHGPRSHHPNHPDPTRVASVPLNKSTNHGVPRTPSKSTSLPASRSDRLAASLLPEDPPAASVSRRQYSLKARKQEPGSPARANAQAALYGELASEASKEHASDRSLPASWRTWFQGEKRFRRRFRNCLNTQRKFITAKDQAGSAHTPNVAGSVLYPSSMFAYLKVAASTTVDFQGQQHI